MADITSMLDELQRQAKRDENLRQRLIATKKEQEPVSAFCKICRELGYEIYEMELILAGEEFPCGNEKKYEWRWRKFADDRRRR